MYARLNGSRRERMHGRALVLYLDRAHAPAYQRPPKAARLSRPRRPRRTDRRRSVVGPSAGASRAPSRPASVAPPSASSLASRARAVERVHVRIGGSAACVVVRLVVAALLGDAARPVARHQCHRDRTTTGEPREAPDATRARPSARRQCRAARDGEPEESFARRATGELNQGPPAGERVESWPSRCTILIQCSFQTRITVFRARRAASPGQHGHRRRERSGHVGRCAGDGTTPFAGRARARATGLCRLGADARVRSALHALRVARGDARPNELTREGARRRTRPRGPGRRGSRAHRRGPICTRPSRRPRRHPRRGHARHHDHGRSRALRRARASHGGARRVTSRSASTASRATHDLMRAARGSFPRGHERAPTPSRRRDHDHRQHQRQSLEQGRLEPLYDHLRALGVVRLAGAAHDPARTRGRSADLVLNRGTSSMSCRASRR